MQISSEFLRDLADVLQRHSKEEWLQLSEMLESEPLRLRVAAAIKQLAEISASLPPAANKKRPKKSPLGAVRSPLAHLKGQDPAKFYLLTRVRQRLLSRELLPSASELRVFGEKLGVAIPNDTKREQAISNLLRKLATMSGEDIRRSLGIDWEPSVSNTASSYDQWVDVIMGDKRAKK